MPRATPGKLQIAAWVCAGVACLAQPWLICTYPATNQLLSDIQQGKAREVAAGWRSVDALMSQVPGNADVAILFQNFDPARPYDVEIAEQTALRSIYAMYPRQVRVAWDGVTLGGGRQILESRFSPDIPWLQSHQIGHVIIYTMGADAQLSIRLAAVPDAQAPVLIPAGGR